MLKRLLWSVLTLFAVGAAFAAVAEAQDSVSAASSQITSAALPNGGERLLPGKVPAEVNGMLDEFVRQGSGKIAGGDREVLAWLGAYKSAATAGALKTRLQTNFRQANWQYEPQGAQNGVEIFLLYRDGKPKRVVMGFFVSDANVFLCALLETHLPGEQQQRQQSSVAQTSSDAPTAIDAAAKIVTVDEKTNWVNVVGDEMPALPSFPALSKKPGKVRGYVKDWTGKPLAGASIGVRSSYLAGYYSGGQGKTDASGYYEITPPKGSAHFYNAGYKIEWGGGLAAVSLHPADGALDSFVTMDGAVENFVLLPYGVTSRERLQEAGHLPAAFYGGAIFLSWYSAEADDNNAPAFAVRNGSTLEITLTPEGETLGGMAGKPIVIRKIIGPGGTFRVHNIPLGRYRIGIRANNKPLKIKDNRRAPPFGLSPAQTTSEASILFVPDSADAAMLAPQSGSWKWVDLRIEKQ